MNKLDICNYALSLVGERPIDDLPPVEDSENSRRCQWFLTVTIEKLLAIRNWRFASKEATLASVSGETSEIGSYVYALPGDCVRPIDLFPLGFTDTWYIVGRKLICEYSEAKLLYVTKNAIDEPLPGAFAHAVADALAVPLGIAVARQNDYVHILRAAARESLDIATTADADWGNEYPIKDADPREDSFVTGASRAT